METDPAWGMYAGKFAPEKMQVGRGRGEMEAGRKWKGAHHTKRAVPDLPRGKLVDGHFRSRVAYHPV